MDQNELKLVSGDVLVRGIENCKIAKVPILMEIIDHIHKNNGTVNAKAVFGSTSTYPLVRAAYHGNTAVVERLLLYGASPADVAGCTASTMESAFSAAVRTNQLKTLELLLHAASCRPHELAMSTSTIHGLLVQALWQAFEQNNIAACQLLVAHGAYVDDTFASMLIVLEQSVKFACFTKKASDIRPLKTKCPRPWMLPPCYVHGAIALLLSVRRRFCNFPLEVVDHILGFLPCEATLFVTTTTLQSCLPRRDYRTSSCKFLILARLHQKNGNFERLLEEVEPW